MSGRYVVVTRAVSHDGYRVTHAYATRSRGQGQQIRRSLLREWDHELGTLEVSVCKVIGEEET